NIDRVKVFARQFDRQLKSALKLVYEKSEEDIDLDLDMNQSTTHVDGVPTTANYESRTEVRNREEEVGFFGENKEGTKKEGNIYDT
ncbi:MAG: hypothetical protein N2053_04495, partial [Chitinispirillaceae bacterium]|nr:hypothetical protein [Chitinispirillaceae bacterium]